MDFLLYPYSAFISWQNWNETFFSVRPLVRSFVRLFGWLRLIDDMKTVWFWLLFCVWNVDCVWVWKSNSKRSCCLFVVHQNAYTNSKYDPFVMATQMCVQSNVCIEFVYSNSTYVGYCFWSIWCMFIGCVWTVAFETCTRKKGPSFHFYSINAFNQQIWQNNFRCVALLGNKNKINFVCFEWSAEWGVMGALDLREYHTFTFKLHSGYRINQVELGKLLMCTNFLFMSSRKIRF